MLKCKKYFCLKRKKKIFQLANSNHVSFKHTYELILHHHSLNIFFVKMRTIQCFTDIINETITLNIS